MKVQENKQLLLKDLCSRLPYGVKTLHIGWDSDRGCEFDTIETLIGIDDKFIHTLWRDEKNKHSIVEPSCITDYKPYLRSMSSMTEEERDELFQATHQDSEDWTFSHNAYIALDWLNAHHFDYRGLIEKDLAIAVNKNNNPYKD